MNIPINNFFIFLTTKTNESMNDRILLALISLIFLFIGCVFLKQGFRAIYCMVKGDKVNAVVTHVERCTGSSYNSRRIYVTYEYNGQCYPHILVSAGSGMEGQAITVYVLPNSPDKPARRSKIKSIFFGVGIAYVAIRMFMSAIL